MNARAVLCLLVACACGPAPAYASAPHDRPIISVLLSTDDARSRACSGAALSDTACRSLAVVTRGEQAAAASLLADSRDALEQAAPDPESRSAALTAIGYDDRVARLLSATDSALTRALSPGERARLTAWLDVEWDREAVEHGAVSSQFMVLTVYATQYAGETSEEAAVPDKYVKFASRNWQHTPGYEGSTYTVSLAYGGRTASGVRVWDVGPWNEDDNFWDPATNWPRPRRLFADLPRGTPEAQAAYYSGYNGGKDQFGRRVLNPAGVDITPAVASHLGLAYLENAWLTVTYLWEEEPTRAVGDSATRVLSPPLTVRRIPGGFDLEVASAPGAAAGGCLQIVDVAGRLLCSWPIAARGASVRWRGERAAGGSAAAGVYVAVFRRGGPAGRVAARAKLAFLP